MRKKTFLCSFAFQFSYSDVVYRVVAGIDIEGGKVIKNELIHHKVIFYFALGRRTEKKGQKRKEKKCAIEYPNQPKLFTFHIWLQSHLSMAI